MEKNSFYFLLIRVFFLILLPLNYCQSYKKHCNNGEFNCGLWECKPNSLLCDGKIDCWMNIDETFETCKNNRCNTTQFHCASGACIPLSLKCNTVPDCFDGSDEADCENIDTNECPKDWPVRCLSGECIRKDQICDGIKDCMDSSDETYSACQANRCFDNEFRCDYGACIDLDGVCNGIPDCVDYSDELQLKCNTVINVTEEIICGKNSFKCNSGLCIKLEKLCDGTRDCDDGSDETYHECHDFNCNTTKRCTYGACSESNCVNSYYSDDISNPENSLIKDIDFPDVIYTKEPCNLPEQPKNGEWVIVYTPITGFIPQPSVIAPTWTILKFTCNDGYTLNSGPLILCNDDGYWTQSFPECLKTCPPLESKNHEIECFYKNKNISCNEAFEGTIAEVKCKDSFEIKNFVFQPYNGIECRNGKWSKKLFDCNPVCGTTSTVQPLVIGGFNAPELGFPWHAGIYKQYIFENITLYEQICGGTLISKRVVLSAAHCFWYGNKPKVDPSKYTVAVGKYYRSWENPGDKYAQYKQIERINIHEKFRAEESTYAYDIAILTLKDPVQLTSGVRPICIDLGNNVYKTILKTGNIGTIPGWGLTSEFGQPAEELQAVRMPYVEYKNCMHNLPQDFRRFITHDKICAGNRNGSNVCSGDSGGGFVFTKNHKYFLGAIVSVAPAKLGYTQSTTCDSRQYVAFTNIRHYLNFLNKNLIID